MMTNPFPTVAFLENSRLQSTSETQFLAIAEELKLPMLAKQFADDVVACPAAINIIGAVAPIRALAQTALRYTPSMGPLGDYLIEATKQWAVRLGGMHGPECLPMSSMTFSEALQQEAELVTMSKKQSMGGTHSADPLNPLGRFSTKRALPSTIRPTSLGSGCYLVPYHVNVL